MTLKKLILKPGINRENTRYTNESGWYAGDKVRFRQGTPEKIGGWQRISASTFLGVCRSLWNWVTLGGLNLMGVGTHIKFYIERGGAYNDITPVRDTASLTNPFTATNGSAVLTVADTAHGCSTGDYVTFADGTVTGLGGNVTAAILKAEYEVTVIDANSYTVTLSVTANATDAAGSPGGGTVSAQYQVSIGPSIATTVAGWGAGGWGEGPWGGGSAVSTQSLRIWNQRNFGEDLVFGPRGGALYYWDATNGVTTRGVALTSLGGASDVPTVHEELFVTDIYRFVMVFGCNDIGGSTLDPMLIRWSAQESAVDWTPSALNQAGSIPLSHGSKIVCAIQTRQEIIVHTDMATYSMQYVSSDPWWTAQLLADGTSIQSCNAAVTAAGVVYWMGVDKFYMYDGVVRTLPCDLLRHVFGNINADQVEQTFAGSVEQFNEIWWFYCSEDSTTVDSYVVYNYQEKIWYYGSLARTAWIDAGLRSAPHAATYSNKLVTHETGVDDLLTATPTAIEAYIESAEFDLDDGHHVGLITRVLPDVTFDGSTATSPSITMTFTPLRNAGSGYTDPASVGGNSNRTVTRSASAPVEAFTGQIYIRVRGRQFVMRVESTGAGTTWQLGAPRIDVQPDGRR